MCVIVDFNRNSSPNSTNQDSDVRPRYFKSHGNHMIMTSLEDTGYPHDGRADKDSYPHDGRADKDSYPHDGRADKDSYPHDRHNQYIIGNIILI